LQRGCILSDLRVACKKPLDPRSGHRWRNFR
jgi:hypothetical protein